MRERARGRERERERERVKRIFINLNEFDDVEHVLQPATPVPDLRLEYLAFSQ